MAYIPQTATTIPIIVTFNDQYYTYIDYPDAVKEILGTYPTVQVAYWDKVEHEYVLNNDPASRVEFRGDYIQINHAGAASGIVKVF